MIISEIVFIAACVIISNNFFFSFYFKQISVLCVHICMYLYHTLVDCGMYTSAWMTRIWRERFFFSICLKWYNSSMSNGQRKNKNFIHFTLNYLTEIDSGKLRAKNFLPLFQRGHHTVIAFLCSVLSSYWCICIMYLHRMNCQTPYLFERVRLLTKSVSWFCLSIQSLFMSWKKWKKCFKINSLYFTILFSFYIFFFKLLVFISIDLFEYTNFSFFF